MEPLSEDDHVRPCKIFPQGARNGISETLEISHPVIVPGSLARNPRFQNPGSANDLYSLFDLHMRNSHILIYLTDTFVSANTRSLFISFVNSHDVHTQ